MLTLLLFLRHHKYYTEKINNESTELQNHHRPILAIILQATTIWVGKVLPIALNK